MTSGRGKVAALRGARTSDEFRLVLTQGGIAPASGTLWSELLDPVMHGGARGVGIAFADTSEETLAGHAVLDSFHLGSMVEYLRKQASVRLALERALARHAGEWRLNDLEDGRRVWKRVRVSCVLFEARNVVTRAQLAGLSKSAKERLLADSDTRGTKSRFTVMLDATAAAKAAGDRARPWDDGHQRLCVFRDAKPLRFSVEG
jgi:hypothetical protein